ncbi:MAG TPA: penicillin-binding transpeptidase domain-containing protein, partial [Polyangia bacterium]|nr:penicillin-binding transpeptidase domain-containing protein [Polyangia bacterium]
GLDGVELALDKQLAGTTSSVVGIRDALGRDLAVDGMPDTPTGAGSDVVLTIDRYLTFVTERALADGQARTHAKDVTAIVMNPQTGEILAMASAPTFNPNDPGEAANGARDRAITDAYEPGSTMKTFTIASALDAGVVRADDRFDCLQGKMMVGKYSIHDTHPHGVLTVAEVFKFSSNIGATKIARRLGRDGLSDALVRFGFGHTTGVGLPGERAGVIRPVDKWGDIGLANVSFGQGLTVTPLQMLTGVSAIAAGGVYHAPRIVDRVVQPDGTIEATNVGTAMPEHRVMSEAAARTMLGIMRGVTEEGGTAKQAQIDGYIVGGKTGTAQKVANGHYDPNKWVSSFVGVVPVEAPRLAVIVVVDEPQGGHLGGAVAAPIFKEIGEQALRYLHVPPSPEALAAAAKAAKAARASAGANADDAPGVEAPATELPVYADSDGPGDDPALAEQWNAVAGAEGGEGEKDDAPAVAPTAIPNFAGMTVGQAIRAARRSGVELAFDDATGRASGVVLAQQPAPGPSSRGALCRVALGRRE